MNRYENRMDKKVTTYGADGQSVSYTKLSSGDGKLTVTQVDGSTTEISASEKAAKDGSGLSEAKRALKDTNKTLSKYFLKSKSQEY